MLFVVLFSLIGWNAYRIRKISEGRVGLRESVKCSARKIVTTLTGGVIAYESSKKAKLEDTTESGGVVVADYDNVASAAGTADLEAVATLKPKSSVPSRNGTVVRKSCSGGCGTRLTALASLFSCTQGTLLLQTGNVTVSDLLLITDSSVASSFEATHSLSNNATADVEVTGDIGSNHATTMCFTAEINEAYVKNGTSSEMLCIFGVNANVRYNKPSRRVTSTVDWKDQHDGSIWDLIFSSRVPAGDPNPPISVEWYDFVMPLSTFDNPIDSCFEYTTSTLNGTCGDVEVPSEYFQTYTEISATTDPGPTDFACAAGMDSTIVMKNQCVGTNVFVVPKENFDCYSLDTPVLVGVREYYAYRVSTGEVASMGSREFGELKVFTMPWVCSSVTIDDGSPAVYADTSQSVVPVTFGLIVGTKGTNMTTPLTTDLDGDGVCGGFHADNTNLAGATIKQNFATLVYTESVPTSVTYPDSPIGALKRACNVANSCISSGAANDGHVLRVDDMGVSFTPDQVSLTEVYDSDFDMLDPESDDSQEVLVKIVAGPTSVDCLQSDSSCTAFVQVAVEQGAGMVQISTYNGLEFAMISRAMGTNATANISVSIPGIYIAGSTVTVEAIAYGMVTPSTWKMTISAVQSVASSLDDLSDTVNSAMSGRQSSGEL
jgi:hypothetical protein